MKPPLRILATLVFFVFIGCNNSAPPAVNVGTNPKAAPTRETDPFRPVLETFRYPENPRSTDDWTRFREGCQQLSAYFARPEVQERMRLSAADRKFLQDDVHLTDDEIAEVESNTFRTADAHYLDECFLLRDAARFLETKGLSPIEQAKRHFRWVMRSVYLSGQDNSWTPPAFVLRRGYGSALERSLVFLALLRQSNMEGCMIVVPQTEPTQYLVAVLDSQTLSLHLFDPRLGMALPGKDGAGATLAEAQKDPKLLASSAISAADAKKLQAWLVCQLYALSPRMLELQKGLSGHDSIALYLNAPRLAEDIKTASKLPVKVWNAPADNHKAPNSPTRALRLFLPKQEGGVDESGRTLAFRRSLMPMDQAIVNYAQPGINLRPGPGLMPDKAYATLLNFTADLFDKYELQTREMFLRGLFEPILRRYERLQAFVRNDSLVGIAGKKSFQKELADWQRRIREANADIVNSQGDPRQQALAQRAFQSLWVQDAFAGWLLNVEAEKGFQAIPDFAEEKKTVEAKVPLVTAILAIGTRSYFERELAQSQACLNHEKAERAQAYVRASVKPTKAALNRAHDAWELAKSSWSNFYIDRIVLDSAIAERLKTIQERVPEQDPVKKLGMLEQLQGEVHQYFEAQMRLSESLRMLDGAAAAQAHLKLVKTQIEKIEKKAVLPGEIKKVREKIDTFEPRTKAETQFQAALRQRLDNLADDWSAHGSFFWLRRGIDTHFGTIP